MSPAPLTLIFALSSVCLSRAAGLNVLIIHPAYGGSHENVLRSLGEQLMARGQGHRFTQLRFLSVQTRAASAPAASPVDVLSLTVNNSQLQSRYFDRDGVATPPMDVFWQRGLHLYSLPWDLMSITRAHCGKLLGDASLYDELRSRQFDVAVVDLISNECGVALARALGLRVVGFWPFAFTGGESYGTSMTVLPSVTPAFLSDIGPEMGFWSRLYNTLLAVAHKLILHKQMSIADEFIQRFHPSLPSAATLIRDIDIILLHSNFYASQAALLPPNIQMLGCIPCRRARPLSEDLEHFMQSAGEPGVIVFSLGVTGFTAEAVPATFINTLLSVLETLPQKVLLRFKASQLPRIPRNVKVLEWIPQVDVLGHSQTRLFIGNAGMSGLMEALYFGLPVLALPIFSDQGENGRFLQYRELGIRLNKHTLTEEELANAIHQLINDNRYRDNARLIADIWRTERETAADRALYWLSLVSRHGAPRHLHMIDRHLNWFQYWLIDVAAVCVAFVAALLAAVMAGCRAVARKFTAETPPKHTKTKTQ